MVAVVEDRIGNLGAYSDVRHADDVGGSRPATHGQAMEPAAALAIPRPLRVGYDIDGVGYDFVAGAGDVCHHYLGVPRHKLTPATRYNFFEEWGVTSSAFWKAAKQSVYDGRLWQDRAPMPGYRESIVAMKAAGHSIHVVTTRPAYAKRATAAWFEKYDIPFDTLDLTSKKTSVPTDVFVDDHEKNLDLLAAAGVVTVCFAQAYNEEVTAHPRVTDHAGFDAIIAELAARPAD